MCFCQLRIYSKDTTAQSFVPITLTLIDCNWGTQDCSVTLLHSFFRLPCLQWTEDTDRHQDSRWLSTCLICLQIVWWQVNLICSQTDCAHIMIGFLYFMFSSYLVMLSLMFSFKVWSHMSTSSASYLSHSYFRTLIDYTCMEGGFATFTETQQFTRGKEMNYFSFTHCSIQCSLVKLWEVRWYCT